MLYRLNDAGQPVPCDDVLEWGEWMETNRERRRVAFDDLSASAQIHVSTVFLGLDHKHFGPGPPILFETLVFGGPLDMEMERYATRDAALKGHHAMVREVRKAMRRKR